MSFHFDHWEIDDASLLLNSTQGLIAKTFSKSPPTVASLKKRVRYGDSCSVILIPCRREYYDAGIDLWYHSEDLKQAQQQVSNEVSALIDNNPALDVNMAMTYLYQPFPDGSAPKTDLDSAWLFQSAFSDAKERLNTLSIYADEDIAASSIQALKKGLNAYDRWVLTVRTTDSLEAAEIKLQNAHSKVSQYDIIIIHESACYDEEGLSPTLLDATKDICHYIRHIYGRTSIIVFHRTTAPTSEDDASFGPIRQFLKEQCTVDLIWQDPVSISLHMLPLVLDEIRDQQQKDSDSIHPSKSQLQYPFGSPELPVMYKRTSSKVLNARSVSKEEGEDGSGVIPSALLGSLIDLPSDGI